MANAPTLNETRIATPYRWSASLPTIKSDENVTFGALRWIIASLIYLLAS
ncbi:MAG TPA: hypothetical protein VHS80_11115 [Chthoniobacterales bacterium]|nr:hypothetical protein [Chthoniobacterales bacterium]